MSSPFISRKPVKYLTNKELLAEIARCKNSYCEYLGEEYAYYDVIVDDLELLTPELIQETCATKSKELTPKNAEPVEVTKYDLIIRLMTYDHIPLDPTRKKKSRASNQTHAVTTFIPFKHFIISPEDDSFKEVGRSHWRGGFENGHFDAERGRITERMGRMFEKLVLRYATKGSYRGYSYNSEMVGLALVHLCHVGLQFDERKSANPFAFYTQTIKHCFIRIINLEKKQQDIRDELLIASGNKPSYTKQVEMELAQSGKFDQKALPAKRGRKTSAHIKAEAAAAKEDID